MSAERHHEHEARHEQQHAELNAEREAKLEELRGQHLEKSHENSEHRAEAAREVIHKHEHAPEPSAHEARPKPHIPQLLNHKLNYQQTLSSIQRKLTPASRSFSKFIHRPVVEQTSDALGKTVARPSVVAGSTWTALIVGIVFYVAARRYGYVLSGSELLIAFVVGGLLGIVLEGAFRTLKRR